MEQHCEDLSYKALSDENDDERSIFSNMGDERRNKLFFIILFTFCYFFIETLVRQPMNEFSEYIQLNLDFPGKCAVGDYLIYFKYEGKVVMFLILYNIANLYTSLSYIILDTFAVFISGTVKLFYLDPRPFWTQEKLYPCICATNYGNPSCTALNVYLVCIIFYRAFYHKAETTLKKVVIMTFVLVPQIFAWISRFIQNAHSISQLIFGALFGYSIQYFYFEVLQVDFENKEQFKKIMNNTFMFLILSISTMLYIVLNYIHYAMIHVTYDQRHISIIEMHCEYIPFEMFDNESYQKTAIAFLFFGSLIGVLLEYKLIFKSKFKRYAKYNLSNEDRWNLTDNKKTFIRMLIMYIMYLYLKKVAVFGNKKTDSVAYLTFGQYIVLYFFQGFIFFFIIKYIFRYLNLSNELATEETSFTRSHTSPLATKTSA